MVKTWCKEQKTIRGKDRIEAPPPRQKRVGMWGSSVISVGWNTPVKVLDEKSIVIVHVVFGIVTVSSFLKLAISSNQVISRGEQIYHV